MCVCERCITCWAVFTNQATPVTSFDVVLLVVCHLVSLCCYNLWSCSLSSVFISRCSKFFSTGLINNNATAYSCAHNILLILGDFSFHYPSDETGREKMECLTSQVKCFSLTDLLISNSRTVLFTWLNPSNENSIHSIMYLYVHTQIYMQPCIYKHQRMHKYL